MNRTKTTPTKPGKTLRKGWFILSARGLSVGCRPLAGPPPVDVGFDPNPVFWTDGPGGRRPYRGPWTAPPDERP